MRKINSMNRRGDIAITILVVGVLAIFSLALLSFIASNIKVDNSLVGIELVEEMNSIVESYSVLGGDVSEMIVYEGEKRFLVLEKKESYWDVGLNLKWRKERILFSVRYPLFGKKG